VFYEHVGDCKTIVCRNNARRVCSYHFAVPALQWLRRGYLSIAIYSRICMPDSVPDYAPDRAEKMQFIKGISIKLHASRDWCNDARRKRQARSQINEYESTVSNLTAFYTLKSNELHREKEPLVSAWSNAFSKNGTGHRSLRRSSADINYILPSSPLMAILRMRDR